MLYDGVVKEGKMETQAKEIRPLLWCLARTLPAVYDSSLSTIETLSKVLAAVNDLITNNNEFIRELDAAEVNITNLQADVEQLQQDIEDVKNGKYVSLYLESIINWIDANLQCLVARIVKFVCFGLTDDGYFVAYIPQSWKFLTFDTGIDYTNKDEYGHLIIQW